MSERANFLKLFLDHEVELRAYITANVRLRDRREDVFQEVATALWESFDRYDPQRSFRAWALGVARNKVLQMWEASKRDAMTFSPDVVELISRVNEDHDDREAEYLEALAKCMEKLKDPARQVLAMRYQSGLSLEEIGQRIGRTLWAAHKTLSRTRAMLGDCVRRRLAALERGA